MKPITRFWCTCIAVVLLAISASPAYAQKGQKTRILFLFDASGSMYAKMENDTRINVAKRTLVRMIDSLRQYKNLEIGLRVFGHIAPPHLHDCKDTRLEVPFSPNNHEDMKNKILDIKPKGTTLIAYSLEQAANDFPRDRYTKNLIILITDGLEECKGDPCAVSEAMQRNGVVLKPYIIGLGSTEEFAKAFACVGKYYDANTEESFGTMLGVIISQAMNATTCQINLLDADGKAGETNVGYTLYDAKTGDIAYNYVHTMNDKGVPDTLILDPNSRYNLVVHTVPQIVKNDIGIIPAKHTIIPVDAGQGDLLLKVEGATQYKNLQAVVKQANQLKIIHVQDFNTKKKYLIGKYDLEVLSTPRIFIKGVDISQSKTTTVNVPQPGKLDVNMATDYVAAIYMMNGKTLEWVCDIQSNAGRQIIVMQPGTYKVMARAKTSTKTLYTFEREFTIQSGVVTQLNLSR